MSRRTLRRYERALAGLIPAEQLPTDERELLVAELADRGMTTREIAEHTRTTEYTTARIRARLDERAHQTRKVPA